MTLRLTRPNNSNANFTIHDSLTLELDLKYLVHNMDRTLPWFYIAKRCRYIYAQKLYFVNISLTFD